MTNKNKYGKVEDGLFVKRQLGSTSGTKPDLEFGHALPRATPYVTCPQTGKTYFLPWQDIIRMAIEAGVTDENAEASA